MALLRNIIVIALAGFSAAGCGQATQDQAGIAALCRGSGITVSNAWVRAARAGQPTSAAYLTIANCTDKDDALTGVSFDGAGHSELHTSSMDANNMASMAHTAKISAPAGGAIDLKPGGAHIMLIGIEATLAPGDQPVMQLEFENSPTIDVVFDVRSGE